MEEVLEKVPEIVMMEAPDYSDYLSSLTERVNEITTLIGGIQGFLVFGAVCILVWATYKFFRMFF